MSTRPARDTQAGPVVRRYETYGLVGGLAIGALLGVLYSGPNFHAWPAAISLLIVFGSAAIGGVVGFLAIWIGAGSTGRGFGPGGNSVADGDGGGGGGDGGGGGNGGSGDA